MSLVRVLEPEVMNSADEARDYDAMDHDEVNRRFVDDLLAELPPHSEPYGDPEKPVTALDLGTGNARIPIELCRRRDDCRVLAVDLADEMLIVARYNVEIAGLRERIQLDLVDAKRLPYRDGQFPLVMSNSIVHHIAEPLDVLREAVRVTHASGRLFFRDLLRPASESELEWLVATYGGTIEHGRAMFAASLRAALTLEEIRKLVADLGFAPESVRQTTDRHWTWSAVRTPR